MSEDDAIWWRLESRLEKKSIYLYGFNLSPRQVVILLFSLLVGGIFSVPMPLNLFGIPFLGKGIVIGIFLLAGFVLSSKRIKAVPPELLIIYRLRGSGAARPKPAEQVQEAEKPEEEAVQKIPVEDFTRPTPYNISGKARVSRRAKVVLLMDGKPIDERYVSPALPQYRFIYLAKPEDIGVHDLEVRLEGEKEPLYKITVSIFPAGREDMVLAMKKSGG